MVNRHLTCKGHYYLESLFNGVIVEQQQRRKKIRLMYRSQQRKSHSILIRCTTMIIFSFYANLITFDEQQKRANMRERERERERNRCSIVTFRSIMQIYRRHSLMILKT